MQVVEVWDEVSEKFSDLWALVEASAKNIRMDSNVISLRMTIQYNDNDIEKIWINIAFDI